MEPEQKKEEIRPRSRRVSFFKKRKKQDTRPLVREHKTKKSRKVYLVISLVILGILSFCGLLFTVRFLVVSYFENRMPIISPEGKSLPEVEAIEKEILESGLEVTNFDYATSSSYLKFTLNGKTTVYLKREVLLEKQLEIVRSIERQMMLDGKNIISIDLRYNKPIVKF